ncbi:unnamed protein product [Cyclocybe aegerita]|uniref:Amino acid transporter transmembrane domain-containing protein n=1 Tax=Cyclocybe aegerita TaxID=1973307 RepID=A0A8S0X477_CYCAE|nr:unnamed protein product [Cyclocybe aegerita]
MASFPASFIGSASSARSSVRDAIQSYRRAQYLVAGSTVASASETSDVEEDDEECQFDSRRRFATGEDEDYDSADENDLTDLTSPARDRDDSFIGQLDWDEDYDSPRQSVRREQAARAARGGRSHEARSPLGIHVSSPTHREDTPLLTKKPSKISFAPSSHPQHIHGGPPATKDTLIVPSMPSYNATLAPPPPLSRRLSSSSALSAKSGRYHFGGRSTFGQTLFNSIAILLGIGMLSEPLAFAYAGWAMGTLLIISYGFIACYTAKILAHVIWSDPRIRSYSDIGRKAFGPKATPVISVMFCLELFAVSVILVTLYGDSLHTLLPEHSSNAYKVWGALILIPTVFLPLSLLSYTSVLGIISTILMVVVIFIDGLSKTDAPGSLWVGAETDVGVKSFTHLGIAFGLFMAGFSGHAVIPSLARDMMDPTQFDRMINRAFVVATCIYTVIGYAGYRMFGNSVSDEISVDLLQTPGYNPALNHLCLWLLVLSPLSKFALNTQPLNATIEILLGIDTPISSPEDLADKPDGLSVAPKGSNFGNWKRFLGVLQRVCLTSLAVAVSIWVPEFSSMMAFLGSFSAFILSIVGPVMAKIMIEGRCGAFDATIVVVGTVMAVWGTVAAFMAS